MRNDKTKDVQIFIFGVRLEMISDANNGAWHRCMMVEMDCSWAFRRHCLH